MDKSPEKIMSGERVKGGWITSKDEKLQQEMVGFDADPRFGPCKTISRLQRWNNALKLGL